MADKYVAIIGGGIAGLAAAYYLHGMTSKKGDRYVCTVFEKSPRLGGNSLTAYFDTLYQKPFADLGVNDFNLAMYVKMGDILSNLARMGFNVPTAKLTDLECFFTARQDTTQAPVVYTSEDLKDGAPPPAGTIYKDLLKFSDPKLVQDVLTKPEYAAMSVGDFLSGQGFSPEFRNDFILPRINAMYFMGENGPAGMPIRGVMSYYAFQEGIGSGRIPDRRYFERGCDQWFQQLQGALLKSGVYFYPSTEVTVNRDGSTLFVTIPGKGTFSMAEVILGVHADRVQSIVQSGLPDDMPQLLARFRYIDSTAVAHKWSGVMPADSSKWRSYNIRIQPKNAGNLPYNISYDENMHQGAPQPTPASDYFVTEDPHVPIPPEYILTMIDPMTGKPRSATASFRHNTITVESMEAQKEITTKCQGVNNLWYTGGWVHGAGLHEEILQVAFEVAMRILGFQVGPLHTYSAEDPSYVPLYIRQVFASEPLAEPELPAPPLANAAHFTLSNGA